MPAAVQVFEALFVRAARLEQSEEQRCYLINGDRGKPEHTPALMDDRCGYYPIHAVVACGDESMYDFLHKKRATWLEKESKDRSGKVEKARAVHDATDRFQAALRRGDMAAILAFIGLWNLLRKKSVDE